jgi:hypothetical protein
MKPNSAQPWLWASLLVFAGQGCSAIWPGRAPYREDPLLLAHKPTAGKPEEAKAVQLAYAEPSLPTLPAFAYVYPPPKSKSGVDDSALADNRAPGQSPKKTATGPSVERANPQGSDDKGGVRIQAMPVLRLKVSGTFGYAPDFSWLQGVVRKSPDGHWQLQFSESPGDAPANGRVTLRGDLLLDQLQDGDVVQVEGNLSAESPGSYRIDRISRVR